MSKLRKIKLIGSYHKLLLFCILLILYFNNVNSDRHFFRSRSQCDDPESLRNGLWSRRRNFLIYSCRFGFKLIGDKCIQCINGKWRGDRPVCAKSGCTADPYYNVRYGRFVFKDTSIEVACSEGYEPVGNTVAYCNGTTWDRPLGFCREYSGKVRHGCDFETSSICGWVAEYSEGFKWRRAMAENLVSSFRTGPHHGGHYMLMESFGLTKAPAVLNSPIYGREISLKTACCFQFYYFMYGAGVGNLTVYVKPVSKMLKDVIAKKENYVKFNISGHQNSNWNEAHFSIEEMDDDFQIVFVADGAQRHLSDIAIDDVKIMTDTECKSLEGYTAEPDDSEEYETTPTDNSLIYDTGSCVNRCFVQSNTGIVRVTDNAFRQLCSCDDKCTEANTCCPDYIPVCLNAPDDDSFFSTNIPPSMGSILTKTTPTTTSETTTTTKSLPSNTTTTTTTKTPPVTIPSTRSSTTTTTTATRKPTTTKSTTTTSTTVKATIPTSTSTISTTSTTISTTRKQRVAMNMNGTVTCDAIPLLQKAARGFNPYPFVQIGEKYYLVNTAVEMNWYEAAHLCHSYDSNLITIETSDEMDAISNFLINNGHYGKYFWTSGNDLGIEGKYMYLSNGRPMSYTRWAEGQPDNGSAQEDCIQLWGEDGKFLMNDYPCFFQGYPICEILPTCTFKILFEPNMMQNNDNSGGGSPATV